MSLKSLVSGFVTLVLVLVFSLATTHVSALNEEGVPQSKTLVQNVHTVDGKLLGRVRREVTVTTRPVTDGVETKVTENHDYELEPEFASISEYQTTFSDGSTTNTYMVTHDNMVYANGELLGKTADIFKIFMKHRVKRAYGGIPRYCHYYDDGMGDNFYFNSYSDISFSWGNGIVPDGNHISKRINKRNPYFYDAKSFVDSFTENLNDAHTSYQIFAAAITTAGFNITNPVSWLPLGGASALSLALTLNHYNLAQKDIQKAYESICAA